jgi:PAS domain S-box-containing protein
MSVPKEGARLVRESVVVARPTLKGAGSSTFESDRPFRQLFAVSPDAMVLIDAEDQDVSWPIVDCNEAACIMNGYTREELIGRSIDVFNVSEGTREERAEYFARLRRDGTILLETFHRHKDGHIFPIEVSTSLVSLGGREFVLGIDRDITHRRRAEEALQRAIDSERLSVERLRELDLMKNTFLTAVSHDLRTPLAAVLGSALTLQRLRTTLSDDEQVQLIDAVASNAERLKRMLEDLLDLGRLTRGVLEPVRSPTDLGGLVRRMVDDSDAVGDHVVHVEVESMIVDIDALKVERILDNLLANARRHTPPGTDIWVSARQVADGVLIAVEDAGPGVSKASQEHIFEPFKQLRRTEHATGVGVGIGLALVAKFAELHGGRAWVQDRPGGGASFRVFLSTS